MVLEARSSKNLPSHAIGIRAKDVPCSKLGRIVDDDHEGSGCPAAVQQVVGCKWHPVP